MTIRIAGVSFACGATALLSSLTLALANLPPFVAIAAEPGSPTSPAPAASAPDPFVLPVNFFPVVATAFDDLARRVEVFVGMFTRGEAEGTGAIWLHPENGSERRLIAEAGYRSPRPSADGHRVAFLREGRPGLLDLASGETRLLPGTERYQRLYGWDEAAGLLLAARGDGDLVRIRLEDGTVTTAAPVAPADLRRLEVLGRMTPEGGVLLLRDNGKLWAVAEKRWGVSEPDPKFVRPSPVFDPAWSPAGILYVSPP